MIRIGPSYDEPGKLEQIIETPAAATRERQPSGTRRLVATDLPPTSANHEPGILPTTPDESPRPLRSERRTTTGRHARQNAPVGDSPRFAPPKTPPPPRARRQALVLYDSRVRSCLLSHLLSLGNVDSLSVHDPCQALELMVRKCFDLVVVDYCTLSPEESDPVAEIRNIGYTGPVLALTCGEALNTVTKHAEPYVRLPKLPATDVFLDTVQCLLSTKETTDTECVAGRPPPPMSILNIEFLVDRVAGNRFLALELLKKFTVQFGNAIERLEALLRQKDIPSARRLIHALSGVSDSIGAELLAAQSKRVENMLSRAAPLPDTKAISDLGRTMKKTLSEIAMLLTTNDGGPK